MLETTLKTDYIPGTNLKGDMVTADWRFLLPKLQFANVGCFGVPPISTVAVFSKMVSELVIIGIYSRDLMSVEKEGVRRGLTNIRTVFTHKLQNLPIPENSLDLAILVGHGYLNRIIKDKQVVTNFCKLLKTNGIIYFTLGSVIQSSLGKRACLAFNNMGFRDLSLFCLAPPIGRIRSAVLLKDKKSRKYFSPMVSYKSFLKNQIFGIAKKFYGSYPRAVVARRPANKTLEHPPEYIVSIANEAGIYLSEYRWGLAAGGRYNSKKILFFLFNYKSELPEIVVKVTRSPEFNRRLENEHRALLKIHDRIRSAQDAVPEPLFFGYHNKLAVLGQKVLPGQPFSDRTQFTENCPVARNALKWITHLGSASVDNSSCSPQSVTQNLLKLLNKFRNIYHISKSHDGYLRQLIENIAKIDSPFPSVFLHGDPGTWNMLVADKNTISVIDWEAWEPRGLPLWDLFYFIKTYGSLVAKRQGKTDSLSAFEELYFSPSALASLLIEVTSDYCDLTQLDKKMVEPLFFTCWIYRALKEATRLPVHSLMDGHYVKLLQLSIERKKSSTLARLFSL